MVKKFYLTHRWDPIRCNHSWPKWTWEQWQEGVLHIPQSSKTGTSSSDDFVSYPGHLFGVLPFCRDAVGVLYSPSRLGWRYWIKEENKSLLNKIIQVFLYLFAPVLLVGFSICQLYSQPRDKKTLPSENDTKLHTVMRFWFWSSEKCETIPSLLFIPGHNFLKRKGESTWHYG